MIRKTKRGGLIVFALALALATGVGGTGRVNPGSVAQISAKGSPSGKTTINGVPIGCC
jgi:hypothetical protein